MRLLIVAVVALVLAVGIWQITHPPRPTVVVVGGRPANATVVASTTKTTAAAPQPSLASTPLPVDNTTVGISIYGAEIRARTIYYVQNNTDYVEIYASYVELRGTAQISAGCPITTQGSYVLIPCDVYIRVTKGGHGS